MNTPNAANFHEPEILKAALQAMRGNGLMAEIEREQVVLAGPRVDALVRVGYGTPGEAVYAVEVKRWLTPKNLGAVVARMRDLGPAALLVTDYATPQVAEKLRELEIGFADAAGNAYLRGANFLVWTNGRRPHAIRRAPRAGRAWQPTGLKVIFALLCHPDWVALGYRDLAARVGVANGTVGWVMRELAEQGFLVKPRRRKVGRRLLQRRKLLDRWVEIYTGTFRQTTLLARYKTDNLDWWEVLDAAKYDVLIGGETAGAILTNYLKPGVVTLYGREVPARLIIDYRLTTAPDGRIEIRRRFWPFDYEWEHRNIVPPVLAYADLLATGDARCIDTARRLYDGYLARLFDEG